MAKSGYVGLCLVLVLVVFAQWGLGSNAQSSIGSLHVFNVDGTVVHALTTVLFHDGSSVVLPVRSIPDETNYTLNIPSGTDCVETSYTMTTPDGEYSALVHDWCTQNMIVSCLPDCYWTIGVNGFSVASGVQWPNQLVTPWDGPH